LAESIYTVDTDMYEYQFMGSLLTLLLNKSLPALKFRIRNDGTVDVLDPIHENRYLYLKLFRKYAKPGIASLRSPNLKRKRRQWVSATAIDAQPVLINFGLLVIQPAPDVCMFMPTLWEYSVKAGGSSLLLLWRTGNPINITINGTSPLAIGKHGIAYLIDDHGKERKLELLQPAKKPLSPNQNFVISLK
jgi:hypothetical protein